MVFKEAVNAGKEGKKLEDFSDARACTNNRFPSLQQLCGALASACPNTATVESDFSVIGWEKDECNFSLEGILHAKQYHCLELLEQQIQIIP